MKLPSLTLLAVVLAARAFAAEPVVIARIGQENVSADAIAPYLAALDPAEKAALEQDPAALNQLVRTLILQQLILKEAVAEGWDERPEVKAEIERIRQGAIAESYLAGLSKPEPGYPDDAELQRVYDASKSQLVVPRQIRLAQIYVAKPASGEDAAREAAGRVETLKKAALAEGADFAALARRESDEKQSAERGGEIGWIAETQLQPSIRKAIEGRKAGAVTGPVALDDGWHFLKVLDIREAHTPGLAEIKDALAARLRAEKARENRTAQLNRLLQENSVAINEIALSQLLKPAKN